MQNHGVSLAPRHARCTFVRMLHAMTPRRSSRPRPSVPPAAPSPIAARILIERNLCAEASSSQRRDLERKLRELETSTAFEEAL